MKVINKDVEVSGVYVRIEGIKIINIKKPATFDFRCDFKGRPTGAKGIGNVHIWMSSSIFVEHFGKVQIKRILRLCKISTLKVLNKLGKIKL